MGFDLGLLGVGAIAARKGYKDAEKEARDEEFLKATRDYQLANAKESADLRPDRMTANRASLGYAAARDTANTGLLPDQTADTRERIDQARQQRQSQLQLLPGQTQIGLAQQSATQKDLAFKESQRPIEETTASIRNRNTKYAVDEEAKMLPLKAAAQVSQGVLAVDSARTHLIGTAASYLNTGDKEGAVAFMQNVFDNTDLFPAGKGKKLQSIDKVENADGTWNARFVDSQGGTIAEIPQAKFASAYMSSVGKKETVKLAPGEKLYGVNQGKATELGDNTNTRYGPKGSMNNAPAEVKLYTFLTGSDPNNPIKEPLGHKEAMQFIKQSKSKSRADFLSEMLAKDPIWAMAPPEKKAIIQRNYESTYDQLHGPAGLGDAPGASNSPAPTTINPDIEHLISGGQ